MADSDVMTTATADTPRSRATAQHIRGSSLLLAGRGVALAVNFAVQVLTVRYLSKIDYGALAYGMALMQFGSSPVALGLDKAASRFVPMYHERGDYPRMFGTILMSIATMVGLGFALILLVHGLQGLWGPQFASDPLTRSMILIFVTLSPVEALDRLLEKQVAVFAHPRAIFFRRFVAGPCLKLVAVLLLIGFGSNVYFLARAHVVVGVIGMWLYGHILWRTIKNQGLLRHFSLRTIKVPAGELLRFSVPICATDALWLVRAAVAVVLLEHFHTTAGVAEFRAVLPVAGLTKVVFESYQLLFMPLAARLLARDDRTGINELYWQSSAWIAMLSFPAFLASFALAKPITVLLFGARYANSSVILAILSLGFFIDAALGFNALTLRVFNRVRLIVVIDVLSFLALVGANLILVPRYGALGGAVATTGGLMLYNLLNQVALLNIRGIQPFSPRHLALYATMLGATALVTAIQQTLVLPIYFGLPVAGVAVVAVFWLNRSVIEAGTMFPELLRFPLLRRLVVNKPK